MGGNFGKKLVKKLNFKNGEKEIIILKVLNLSKYKMMKAQILQKKLDLIQWLSTLEDQSMIEKLINFRKKESKDWWNSISEDEKSAIEKGISEADEKKLKPHSEARKIYEKWL
jgi:hypothetical protein